MYIHQIFSWFHLGTRDWHEHVGDGCERVIPNWIPDWEPAQESCEACAVDYIWKISEKKWFPSHHSHLVVFSQWSQAHIIALANSTIFFLTSNTDLQLEVIEKLHVCQYNSSQGTLKRPEVPRDWKAFCPNSSGSTACTCPLPPLPKGVGEGSLCKSGANSVEGGNSYLLQSNSSPGFVSCVASISLDKLHKFSPLWESGVLFSLSLYQSFTIICQTDPCWNIFCFLYFQFDLH